MKIQIDDLVIYENALNQNFLGRVIDIDSENDITYVWFGVNDIYTSATDTNSLILISNIEEIVDYDIENYDVVERIFQEHCEDVISNPYFTAIRGMVNNFNNSNYGIRLNELDLQMMLKNSRDYRGFVDSVKRINEQIMKEEEKKK